MGVGTSEGETRRRHAAVWWTVATLVAWGAPAAAVEPTGAATDPAAGEVDLGAAGDGEAEVFWGPNRFGFGMAVGTALWNREWSDGTRYLWDGNGEALLAMQCDYHRMFGDWFGIGGSLLFPASTDAYFLTGLALSIGPRVYLWPDWVYLQVEAAVGYPPLVGAIGTIGVSIPLFGGARLRLENQFWLNVLEDEAEFTFAWFPAFAAEMGF
ncbi:MAG: hypothetical protein JXB32_08860 [Deltaproteobacteria bacterium]|nr:hypothetical protein [Deltaproteobacteria bacterium]